MGDPCPVPGQGSDQSVLSKAAHSAIKREPDAHEETGSSKRTKETATCPLKQNLFITPDKDRRRDEADKSNVYNIAKSLEAQLQKSREDIAVLKFQFAASRLSAASQSKAYGASPSNNDGMPARMVNEADIKLLTDTVTDLSAEKAALQNIIRAKDQEIREKDEELLKKDQLFRTVEQRFSSATKDLRDRRKLHEAETREIAEALNVAQENYLEQMGHRHRLENNLKDIQQRLQNLQEKHTTETEKLHETIEKLRRKGSIRLKKVKKYRNQINEQRLQDNEAQELHEQIEKLRRKGSIRLEKVKNYRKQLAKAKLTRLENSVTTQQDKLSQSETAVAMLTEQLLTAKAKNKDLDAKLCKMKDELHVEYAKVSDLMAENQELVAVAENTGHLWKDRTQEMYGAYQVVHEKNQKLIVKLKAVWKAGSFDAGLSKRNRNVLNELRGCPLHRLFAYHVEQSEQGND